MTPSNVASLRNEHPEKRCDFECHQEGKKKKKKEKTRHKRNEDKRSGGRVLSRANGCWPCVF